MMIYNAGHPPSRMWRPDPLDELHHELKLNNPSILSTIKLVSNAKVPIIKLTSSLRTGEVKVDIAIATSNAPPSSVAISKFLQEMPVLRPLILTLKQFLFQFNLHDTYTGGVGSFALALMVISVIQIRKAAKTDTAGRNFGIGLKDTKFLSVFAGSDDIGSLLASFFLLYGRLFDLKLCGISVRDGGYYFRKRDRNWDSAISPVNLCIEDPTDENNDVGRNSYNFQTIRGVFYNAFLRLTAQDNEIPIKFPSLSTSTLLSRIITVDEEILSLRSRAGTLVGALVQEEKKQENKEKNKETPKKESANTTPKRKWDF